MIFTIMFIFWTALTTLLLTLWSALAHALFPNNEILRVMYKTHLCMLGGLLVILLALAAAIIIFL